MDRARSAAAEGSELVAAFDDVLDLFCGFGLVEGVGVEGEVAGPVRSWCALVGGLFGRLFGGGDEAGEHGSGEDGAGAFEELSFIHVALDPWVSCVEKVQRIRLSVRSL